jgi:hypothetical protein
MRWPAAAAAAAAPPRPAVRVTAGTHSHGGSCSRSVQPAVCTHPARCARPLQLRPLPPNPTTPRAGVSLIAGPPSRPTHALRRHGVARAARCVGSRQRPGAPPANGLQCARGPPSALSPSVYLLPQPTTLPCFAPADLEPVWLCPAAARWPILTRRQWWPLRPAHARAGRRDGLYGHGEGWLYSCEYWFVSCQQSWFVMLLTNHLLLADDCWQLTNRTLPWENAQARQIANPTRFPKGMRAVADFVHAKGLKFGICPSAGRNQQCCKCPAQPLCYLVFAVGPVKVPWLALCAADSARCRFTCQLFAASFSHEVADAEQWAEWGVDYLKLCGEDRPTPVVPSVPFAEKHMFARWGGAS